MTRRTANILIAVAGVLVLCLIAVVGAGIWFVRSAIDTESSNEAVATQAFDEVERYGPALVIDHREEDGEHILVWSD